MRRSKAPSAPSEPALQPGEVLADRFEIVRLLARGGMGEVYEARDLSLGGTLALKTIRPEIARDDRAVERFKREVLLARRVTHPNVCRVFDFGSTRHDEEALHFVTMELLSGETLDQRSTRVGRWTTGELLPLVRQLTEALHAAHIAGVTHRDLKGANVMLVGPAGEERAVVTDFGLAFERRGEDASNRVAGTPAYMAPEQLDPGPIGPWTDLYALGVVLFELVTGRLPLSPGEGEDAFAEFTRARLACEAPSPQRFVPDLDPRWEAAILRCLERAPERRFTDALELWRALAEDASPRSIAILPLASEGDVEHAWWGEAAAMELARALTSRGAADAGLSLREGEDSSDAGGSLRIVTGDAVVRAAAGHRGPSRAPLDRAALARLAALARVDLVIGGSFTILENRRVAWRWVAQETRGGRVRLSREGDAALDDWRSEVFARELRELLDLGVETEAPHDSAPEHSAARAYATGLAAFHSGALLRARDALLEASSLVPERAEILRASTEVQEELGDLRRARDSASSVFRLARSRAEELELEARLRKLEGNTKRAADLYRSLWILYPESIEHAFALIEVELLAGKEAEVLRTIEELRSLPRPLSADPRIDLWEARAHLHSGRSDALESAADRLIERASLLGARDLRAEGLHLRSLAACDPDEAATRLTQALLAWEELFDRAGVARVREGQGDLALSVGEGDTALARYREAIGLYQSAGRNTAAARATTLLASALPDPADESVRLLRGAITNVRDADDSSAELDALMRLAIVLQRVGRFDEATLAFEQAAEAPRVNARQSLAALHALGTLLLSLGRSEEARAQFEEALRRARAARDSTEIARALANRARASLDLGDPRAGSTEIDEALVLLGDRTDDDLGARARWSSEVASRARLVPAEVAHDVAVTRAALLLALGRLEDAERALSTIDDGTDAPRIGALLLPIDELDLRLREADAALLAGDLEAAERAALRARELRVGTVPLRLWLERIEARIAWAHGHGPFAHARAEALREEASRAAFLGLELEARLLLGEIELEGDEPERGRARLEALRDEAAASGHHLISRAAEARLHR